MSDTKTCEAITRIMGGALGAYFLLYELDRLGLTDHGSSVWGCWLTDRGRDLLAELDSSRVKQSGQ